MDGIFFSRIVGLSDCRILPKGREGGIEEGWIGIWIWIASMDLDLDRDTILHNQQIFHNRCPVITEL